MKEIPITNTDLRALVDDQQHLEWHLGVERYAYHGNNTAMHRVIMGCPVGMEIHHINGNRLDNRRENLSVMTSSEHKMTRGKTVLNKSGYKGVSRDAEEGIRKSPWRAQIGLNGKKKLLGRFKTKEEAARAYDKAAVEFYGHNVTTNFPQ